MKFGQVSNCGGVFRMQYDLGNVDRGNDEN